MRVWIGFFLIFIGTESYSQPIALWQKINNQSEFSLSIQADPKILKELALFKKTFKIGSQFKDFSTIYTSDIKLIQFLRKQPWVKRLEISNNKIVPMLDTSRILNNVDSIHQGIAPLALAYKGKNVLIGIIDFGIEWRHLDFKDSSGSRILRLWDQNKDSVPPLGYSYGHLFTKSDIDQGKCFHKANLSFGHGTNVSGIAAGNGSVLPQYRGMAPEAKIAYVSLKNDNTYESHIIDGINFLFKLADSLGLPCVINISVGGYDGSHDGRDANTRMIEATLNKKGRSIVAAAGNAGNLNQHIRFAPNNDTSFTDFVYTSAYAGTYFNFWADTADVKNLTIGLQADSNITLLPISNSYHLNFKSQFQDSLNKYGYYEDSLEIFNVSGLNMGKAFFYVLKQENTVNWQCYIVPKKTTYLWRFTATGSGILDMWVNGSLQTTSNIYSGTLPSTAINPKISQFKTSDQSMSIVSGFQCSDKIITVANYVNKYGIIDIDSIYRPIGGKQNEISGNSSKGPTRDGRLKPDIAASGGQTVTTIDSVTSAQFALNATNRKKLAKTGKYSVAGGTSMASPVVAGCIALLLEKSPNLDYNQIKYLIKLTAKKDSFTSSTSNNIYGHGKINGYQLIKYNPSYGCRDTGSINYNSMNDFEDSTLCIKKIYGCTDTGSINYSSSANVNNGSCILKVYGCTDTGSINYSSLANVNNGSCIPKVYGCTDTGSINYSSSANVNNDSCIPKVYGCTDTGSINYSSLANVNNGSCIPKVYGCTDTGSINYSSSANVNNGSCIPKVNGCTDTGSINYSSSANINNGSCIPKVYGCTDIKALNYNAKANVNDSSCSYPINSINLAHNSLITIYPNPSNGFVNIDLNENKTAQIEVFSTIGLKLMSMKIQKNQVLDLTHLTKGIYFLQVEMDKQNYKFCLKLK